MPKLGLLYRIAVTLTRQQKRSIILSVDVVLIALSYLMARTLIVDAGPVSDVSMMLMTDLLALLSTGTIAIVLLGLHKIKLNAYQMQGVVESAFVGGVLLVVGLLTSYLVGANGTSPQVFVITSMIFLIFSVSSRLIMRHVLLLIYSKGNPRMPIIIYGAGQTGQQLASALATDYSVEPVAFVDDDRRLQGLLIAGLKVLRPGEIQNLVEKHGIKRVVLAMPSVQHHKRAYLARRLARLGCEVHALPSFADLVNNAARDLSDTRPVDINELLGRDGLEEELPGVADAYAGKNVLITGAGGSIGSELCRQMLTCDPDSLILLDHSEWALFEIDRELQAAHPTAQITAVLGSVTDKSLIETVLAEHKIDIILHAAAYKHVPLVQNNALEGIRNNVFGTKTVADAARAAGVDRFILVSTDKAVRPSSVMGTSKRFAELLIQDLATRSKGTRFSMVRFGNVLGSSGSVIPLFHEQISRGGPVTLTHSDVTRYFMTIPEAVRLVLLAGSFARGGDVFVLDMGQPVPIKELARKMIESAGYTVRDADTPDGDIELKITGLRPGEKLHEELLIGSDMLTTPHPKIMRAQEKHLSEHETANAVQSLRQAIETRNPELLFQTLEQWIETGGETIKIVNE